MKMTTSKLNTSDYLEQFKQARQNRADKQTRLPYAKKIAIVERLQAEHKSIRESVSSLKPSKT